MRHFQVRQCLWHHLARQKCFRYLSSGPQGVEGRLPHQKTIFQACDDVDSSQTLAITDPYLLYQSYIRLGILSKDENQVRVMKEFQKLYHRVVNYVPAQDLQIKISLVLRKLEVRLAREREAERKRGINHIVHKLLTRGDTKAITQQVVRFLTDEEELQNFDSPHGLLVNGEVGCGKSMLMDIFATSLPHESKMRWHYNNFILWIYSEIHRIQQERFLRSENGIEGAQTMENEFILFEIAQKMIQKSTVLMLDEFMLPDIASANIVKILFTYYFKLGGVLVATSNKLPDDLYSTQFHKDSFKTFVLILHSRCHSVDMNSAKDYRHDFASASQGELHLVLKSYPESDKIWNRLIKKYALKIPPSDPRMADDVGLEQLNPERVSFKVYNRKIDIPMTFGSVCVLDYSHICQGLFSSSDYITIASKFLTVVLDDVPVMTTKMKNEARRFITLLDALYEAKCQLFLRCEVGLESLFFPDASGESEADRLKVQEEEMFARTAIDLSNPYRPNVLTYDQEHTEEYKEEEHHKYDFKDAKAFTGEDEKFAYKRAVLRIHEMVNSDNWRYATWVPIDNSMRPWEQKTGKVNFSPVSSFSKDALEKELEKRTPKEIIADDLPRQVSNGYGIPFRQFNSRIAPVFTSVQHFWGWGKSARNIRDEIAKRWVGRKS
ncbi:hypothetical protein QFC19_004378 [Naganishia cerealis]|uniref:Uncharacterized protein n=1 Tax=Naganishia cerealis TaxID=610337 RepID=A0ACC2VYF9_9TREE|nr:hypothetical protein QFC19_004378 [Naganishia cerealis]